MNSLQSNRKAGASTLVEMLVVIAIIAILAALLLPVLNEGQSKAKRIQCLNNLKELGTAFHSFSHDHRDQFPMQIPASEGGTLELAKNGYLVSGEFYFSFRHFAMLSNELVTPKLLLCPSDLTRQRAPNFSSFQNENLSYFVGVKAEYSRPGSVLAGNRNVTNDWIKNSSIVRSGFGGSIRWTGELHHNAGNVLFADSHTEQLNNLKMATLSGQKDETMDFVLPSIQPPTRLRLPRPVSFTPSHPTSPAAHDMTPAAGQLAQNGNQTPPAANQPVTATNQTAPVTNLIAPVVEPEPKKLPPPEPLTEEPPDMRWLLYLILLLFLIALTIRLLTRPKRVKKKRKEEDDDEDEDEDD